MSKIFQGVAVCILRVIGVSICESVKMLLIKVIIRFQKLMEIYILFFHLCFTVYGRF